MRQARIIAALVMISAAASPALADKIGVTVDAAQTVREISGSKARLIVTNAEIYQNDRLRANATGNAQIQLVDGTKIVVGPNADVRIDDFVYNGGPTLQKLTVSATRGAFRFITGRSAHSAYKINTPYGTIGVRGTAFDVSISGGATNIALLSGGLRVCDRRRACREIRNPCEFVQIGRHGINTGKLNSPSIRTSTKKLFPLLASQGQLRPQFRQIPAGCSFAYLSPTVPVVPTFVPIVVPAVIPVTVTPPPVVDPVVTGNPGNDKGVGNAGEQPGNGGFGKDGVTGKGNGGTNNGSHSASHGNSASAPGHNK
ncbi:MAG: FecR domain-containing protein [Salaquimonas sp.]|jgi:hypothetical protein|nr:FecR domain-containing protein [Salaquimonas sp.]